jgi:drug/metabolite transporter (DMT)-like permease
MIGEACALGAAMCWSTSLILFKRSESVTPLGMNLFKNVVAIVLLMVTMLALGLGFDSARSNEDWLRLVVSGVLGIAVADTLIFMALERLGASLLAVVDCAYAPTMVCVSMLALGERVTVSFLVGGVLVVGGVLASVFEKPVGVRRGRDVAIGAVQGIGGILVMGFGVILSKPIVERASLVEVTLVRLVAGAVAQCVWIAAVPSQRTALAVLRPSPTWRTLVPAAVLSAYLSMLLWLGGFKWTTAARASVLNQMTTVFTIVMARFFLGEPLSKRRALGASAAIAGVLVVLLSNS